MCILVYSWILFFCFMYSWFSCESLDSYIFLDTLHLIVLCMLGYSLDTLVYSWILLCVLGYSCASLDILVQLL